MKYFTFIKVLSLIIIISFFTVFMHHGLLAQTVDQCQNQYISFLNDDTALGPYTQDTQDILALTTGEAFFEDFEDGVADNWIEDASGAWVVIDGKYKMIGYASDELRFSHYDGIYKDFFYKVDVIREQGRLDCAQGLTFRKSDEGTYGLGIAAEGYMCLEKLFRGEVFALIPWTKFPVINRGLNKLNKLRVIFIGSNISIYINDEFVKEVIDRNPLPAGQVGLLAYDEKTDLEKKQPIVSFDNVELGIIVGPE